MGPVKGTGVINTGKSYYGVYGGATAQYPVYGSGPGGMMTGAAAFYPYLQYDGEGSGGGGISGGYSSGQGYGVNYAPHLFQYSSIASTAAGAYAQHYGTPMSLAPSNTNLTFVNQFGDFFNLGIPSVKNQNVAF